MDLASFKRHHKTLLKLWEQVQEHMAIYVIDIDAHLGHYYFKSLIEMLNEVLENAEDEKDEDDIDADITVIYEYDDDSLELLEYLENSDFFS
jgi:hypothetical protein